ncbi:MAG: phosphoglucosamine mutase [Gammaproteobacteria bacterium]|nr:phosphoglucosamine mutase [Gammaproteobacteria bacterium]
MTRKYFGTDGVRGKVGEPPMTVDFALRMASAAAQVLMPDGGMVVIGKDTRVSGYMFESALEAGFVAAGVNVRLLGPLPTPGIAYFTQLLGGDLGVVISASHNPYYDNGIKFFDGSGAKLSDEQENQIEALIEKPIITRDSADLGRAVRVTKAVDSYKEHCKQTFPPGVDLNGLKIVVDCAHGAGYKAAPRVLADLGAELIPIGCSPNGRNINADAGSTKPELLQLTVKGVRADLGIALDGDGDRLVMVDNEGRLVDGDQLLFVLATEAARCGELKGPVVGTVMSNLGLEHALKKQGIKFLRAKVGDRNVLAMLREHGGTLGGETSGHILCLDKSTTGDGIVAALQVLAAVRKSGRSLAELVEGMPRYPQTLINVRTPARIDLDASPVVVKALSEARKRLADTGRVVLRPSGTEPVIRVMVEGEDKGLVDETAATIADAVREAARDAA